jgi:tetraacyldisaccharide-1-P 4'-kinase
LLEKQIIKYSAKFPSSSYYGNYNFKTLNLQDDFDIQKLKNAKVYSLSAIGFAKGFENSLIKAGIKTQKNFNLKDHKNFTKKDMAKIFNEIGSNSFLVITAKDAVKLENVVDENQKHQTAVLTVTPIFKDNLWQEKFLKPIILPKN